MILTNDNGENGEKLRFLNLPWSTFISGQFWEDGEKRLVKSPGTHSNDQLWVSGTHYIENLLTSLIHPSSTTFCPCTCQGLSPLPLSPQGRIEVLTCKQSG